MFMNEMEHRLTRVRLVGPLSLGNSLYWIYPFFFWIETAHGMKRGSLNHDDHGLQQNLCKPLNMYDNVVQRSGMNVWSYQHHCVTGESHSWLCDCKCDANGRVDKAQTNLKRCGVNMMMWLNQHDGHWQTARVTFNNRDHWHSLRATKCLSPLVRLMVSHDYSFVLRWDAKRMQTLMRSQETRFNVSTTSTNSASDLGPLRGNTDRTVQYQPSCWLRSHWNLMDSSLLRVTVIMYSTASSILSQSLFQNILWICNSEYYWLCSSKLQKMYLSLQMHAFMPEKIFHQSKLWAKQHIARSTPRRPLWQETHLVPNILQPPNWQNVTTIRRQEIYDCVCSPTRTLERKNHQKQARDFFDLRNFSAKQSVLKRMRQPGCVQCATPTSCV